MTEDIDSNEKKMFVINFEKKSIYICFIRANISENLKKSNF